MTAQKIHSTERYQSRTSTDGMTILANMVLLTFPSNGDLNLQLSNYENHHNHHTYDCHPFDGGRAINTNWHRNLGRGYRDPARYRCIHINKGQAMKYCELATTLSDTLNKLTGQQLEPGQYKKTNNGYIGRRLSSGSYCSATTLADIKSKVQS